MSNEIMPISHHTELEQALPELPLHVIETNSAISEVAKKYWIDTTLIYVADSVAVTAMELVDDDRILELMTLSRSFRQSDDIEDRDAVWEDITELSIKEGRVYGYIGRATNFVESLNPSDNATLMKESAKLLRDGIATVVCDLVDLELENAGRSPMDWVAISEYRLLLSDQAQEARRLSRISYLGTMAGEAGESVPDDVSKAEASKLVDEMQDKTGRG